MSLAKVQTVRILYKAILRLHRGLPEELRELGTSYAREEFKKHKNCDDKEAEIFINEWTGYALSLADQLGIKKIKDERNSYFGAALSEKDLDKFRDEQIHQLYELMQVTKAPKEPNGEVC